MRRTMASILNLMLGAVMTVAVLGARRMHAKEGSTMDDQQESFLLAKGGTISPAVVKDIENRLNSCRDLAEQGNGQKAQSELGIARDKINNLAKRYGKDNGEVQRLAGLYNETKAHVAPEIEQAKETAEEAAQEKQAASDAKKADAAARREAAQEQRAQRAAQMAEMKGNMQELKARRQRNEPERLTKLDEKYKGPDKEDLRKRILEAWKGKYPQDDVVRIAFHMEDFRRDVNYQALHDKLQRSDISVLPVSVAVRQDDQVAIIYPAFVNRDNASKSIDIGVDTKKGSYIIKEILLSDVKK